MNLGQKLLLVAIAPKNKDKFKTMEEAKSSMQKAFCPSWNKARIKQITERKEDIVVETDTVKALQKLQNLMGIGRQFLVEEVNRQFVVEEVKRAKTRIIIYDLPTIAPEDMIKKMIFRQNDIVQNGTKRKRIVKLGSSLTSLPSSSQCATSENKIRTRLANV